MHEVSRERFPWAAVGLATAGGALLIVGSFQAWSEISGGGTTAALYGIDDRSLAWVTLGAGIAVLLLTLVLALARGLGRRVAAFLVMVTALVGAAVGTYEAVTAKDVVLDDFAEQLADDYGGSPREMRELLDQAVGAGQLVISTGMGVYLAIAGGALGVAGGVLAMRGGAGTPAMPESVPAWAGATGLASPAGETTTVAPGTMTTEVPPPPVEVAPAVPSTPVEVAPAVPSWQPDAAPEHGTPPEPGTAQGEGGDGDPQPPAGATDPTDPEASP